MKILSLYQIHKSYTNTSDFAVEDVSFDVMEGEILALVGESGSGKTTLLRLIAGLEHPDKGHITLSDQRIVEGQRSLPAHKRQVGMVFQDYALFPHLTLLENVKFGLNSSGNKNDIAQNALELVGLEEDFNKYPHQLSGGQQQRVALARAIAPNPKVLLMDEPFSNLDTVLKDQVREEIRQIIKKSGVTAIFVTHDTKDALSTADRIAILHRGRVQQIDPPRRLYEQPTNAYVANFFGKMNCLEAMPSKEGFYTPFGFIKDERAVVYHEQVQLHFRPEHAIIQRKGEQYLYGKLYKVAYFGDHQLVKLEDEEGKKISIKTSPTKSIAGLDAVSFSLIQYKIVT